MSSDLVPVPKPRKTPAVWGASVVDAWLSGRSPRTLKAYAADLADFARFMKVDGAATAIGRLLAMAQGDANCVALTYKTDLLARNLSTATVARRLAALRSVVKCGRMLGKVAWSIDVESPRAERYRDTAGPGAAAWDKLWSVALAAGDGPKARRDRAILLLLNDRGLRRGELVALDLADVELAGEIPSVAITGKGRSESERLTVNLRTRSALASWLEVRGTGAGPLFTRLDPGGLGQRLTGEGVRLICSSLSHSAKLDRDVRPHGLRHHAITKALDMTHGNVRDVAVFSRHKDIKTLMIYDDRRRDVGGSITRMLAGEESEG